MLKACAPEELIQAIRKPLQVHAGGGRPMSMQIALGKVVDYFTIRGRVAPGNRNFIAAVNRKC